MDSYLILKQSTILSYIVLHKETWSVGGNENANDLFQLDCS